MSSSDPTRPEADDPAAAPPEGVERARAVIEQQIDLLSRLAVINVEVAEALGRQTVAQAAELAAAGDHGDGSSVTQGRLARSVRLTLALQARFVKDLLNLDKAEALDRPARDRAAAARAEAEAEPDPLEARRERIARIAVRVIEAEEGDEEELERLSGDVWERLTDEDIYGDIQDRPMGEILARLCQDLELSPDWASLAREAWAVAEAESGAAGSPFVKVTAPQAGSP